MMCCVCQARALLLEVTEPLVELKEGDARIRLLKGLLGTASAMLVSAESWAGEEDCMALPILRVMIQLQERIHEEAGVHVLDPEFAESCRARIKHQAITLAVPNHSGARESEL